LGHEKRYISAKSLGSPLLCARTTATTLVLEIWSVNDFDFVSIQSKIALSINILLNIQTMPFFIPHLSQIYLSHVPRTMSLVIFFFVIFALID
jgi:hypothetical protein